MDPVTLATILIPVAVIVLFILIRMFRVIPEYERGISFRFGHLRSELKPGLNVVFPSSTPCSALTCVLSP